jgi:two-component system, LytTR family, response regulator
MIKAIIVDNDVACISLLDGILKDYCKNIQVCAQVTSIKEAVTAINEFEPHVIFLDIELDNELGFDLFKYFSSPNFQVIFTTSHEKFALRAIRSSCLDYILKPIDAAELVNAVSKLNRVMNATDNEKKINALVSNTDSNNSHLTKLAVPSSNSVMLINVNEIICLEGDMRYTTLYIENGDKIVSSKNIGEYENLLDSTFFRCHKSWIVNLKFAKRLLKNDGQIQLSNDMLIDISTRKKDEFLKLFGKA